MDLKVKKVFVARDYDVISFLEHKGHGTYNEICKRMVDDGLYTDDGSGSVTLYASEGNYCEEGSLTHELIEEMMRQGIAEMEIICG